jgi:PhnB protein
MMDTIKLENYLFFPGKAQEAMDFYKGIFGGELATTTRGSVDPEAPEDMKDLLIHADLSGGMVHLMGADDTGTNLKSQGRISLSLNGAHSDEAVLRKVYDQLAEGGEADHPLQTEFWGDTFGGLTDKYGIRWLINIAAEPKADAAV